MQTMNSDYLNEIFGLGCVTVIAYFSDTGLFHDKILSHFIETS